MIINLCLQPLGAGTIWTDSDQTSGNWRHSPWYGWIYSTTEGPGWAYHDGQGWIWVQGPAEDDLWSWDPCWGWMRTTRATYPFYYAPNRDEWLYLGDDAPTFALVTANGILDAAAPVVVSSVPGDGADTVSVDQKVLSVTFSQPMLGAVSWSVEQQWGGSYATWSWDKRTVEIRRFDTSAQLPALTMLRFTLNPNGRGFAAAGGALLAPHRITFTIGPVPTSAAHVVGCVPANNAMNVDPMADTVEIRFSEPMMPVGGLSSSGWWPWTMTWSADSRTCFIKRGTSGTPLYGQSVYLATLYFKTANGSAFTPDFALRFTTADPPAERIDADPAKGFHWPYYLLVPSQVSAPGTLLVEPNNTGTWNDDPLVHEEAAVSLIRGRAAFAMDLGCPLLVPLFPRPRYPEAPEPGGIYIHALDRYSLGTRYEGLQRIDLQMAAMIGDALQRLRARGHAMDDKVFMMGFSASGSFTSRFALLHPERIKAAAAGSPGGWPLAPVASWQGTTLKYALGIADLPELTGQPFNLSAFKQVPLYIYVGDADTNDAFDVRGMSEAEKSAIYQFLNYPADPILAHRWPLAQAIYQSVGASAQFVTYPGVSHYISTQMYTDIANFFKSHR